MIQSRKNPLLLVRFRIGSGPDESTVMKNPFPKESPSPRSAEFARVDQSGGLGPFC